VRPSASVDAFREKKFILSLSGFELRLFGRTSSSLKASRLQKN